MWKISRVEMVWFNNQYSGWMQFLSRLCSKTVDEIREEKLPRRLFEAAWMCLWRIRCFRCFGWGDFSVRSFWSPSIQSFNMLVLVSSVSILCRAVTIHTKVLKIIIGGPQPCVCVLLLLLPVLHGFYRRFFDTSRCRGSPSLYIRHVVHCSPSSWSHHEKWLSKSTRNKSYSSDAVRKTKTYSNDKNLFQ